MKRDKSMQFSINLYYVHLSEKLMMKTNIFGAKPNNTKETKLERKKSKQTENQKNSLIKLNGRN